MRQNPLTATIHIFILLKGFILLNVALLPITLLLTLFIGIMAGGAPNSPSPWVGFAMSAGFIFLIPFGVLLGHLLIAKGFDAVLRLVPLRQARVSVLGILVAAVLLVIAGNIFVDDLYQFRQGDYTMSAFAFVADLVGMGIVVGVGMIRFPWVDRLLRLPR